MTGVNGSGETSGPPIRKFNPGTFQSDEEVIEQFVVRKHELDVVLEVLRDNVDSQSCQHVMVVGPRGRGKTMLLVRTAAEIRSDERLARRLLPVRFMEESQEIFDMADFWLEALFHLAREIVERDTCLSQNLRDTHRNLSSRWREQSLEMLARATVLDAADRLDRKLVLMVENLQSLCENVGDNFGWKLREVLQSEPQVMLLASATSRFGGLDDVEKPFFELFRTISLQPLDSDESRLLWEIVSGDTASSRVARPLQILTGGNPRLLIIVAEFARHRSLRRLMEELVTLIDEHTEYFRGHLEVLAKTERRVYVSVIDLWQPSSAGEIAARARTDVRVVSTMLGRLADRGAVIVEGRGRKRLYTPAEPLYSIYYKLRRERDEAVIVENLIHFMVAFYDIRETSELGDPEGAIAAWDRMVGRNSDSDASELRNLVIGALINKGMFKAELGRADEALHVCDELESRTDSLPESEDSRHIWGVMCVRALALMVEKKGDAALQAFRCAYARFAHDNETSMREMLHVVPYLVAAGASERDLVDILSSDSEKSAALTPLIVALRERQGETVRAPAEVREVAADVRKQIEDRVTSWADAAADSPT